MENRKTVYRFRDASGNYLYTASTAERNDLVLNSSDFVFNGASYFSADEDDGATVYRLRDTENNSYFYTTSEDERDSFAANSKYELQDETFQALTSNTTDATEIYRLYDATNDIYAFTPSVSERDSLVNLGFESQGVAFYGFPLNSDSDTAPSQDPISNTPTPPPTNTQNNFAGADIEVQVFTPDLQSPSGDPTVATVIDGQRADGGRTIEFGELPSSDINSTNTVDNNIDISANSIEFIIGSSSIAGSFGQRNFNGYVFTDINNEIDEITNVTIDPAANDLNLTAADINFTENAIEVNVAGLNYAPGDTVKLDVEFGGTLPPETGTGIISGLVWNDLNRNANRDTEFIQGDNPDVVFVIDVSGSTGSNFGGTAVGDRNSDGREDDILDAELAAFIELNQLLIDQDLEDVNVGIVPFGSSGVQVDMNLEADGVQLTATPNADANNNDIPDVEEILTFINNPNVENNPALGAGGGTNFRDALATAQQTFTDIGTEAGNGNLIFLSDGGSFIASDDEELTNLQDNDVNISAFGVGSSSNIDSLRVIDPAAEQFTSTNELLEVFNNRGTVEQTLEGIQVYLDANNNGQLDDGESVVETDASGRYEFTELLAGNYTVRQVIPSGFDTDSVNVEQYTVTLADDETITGQNFGIAPIQQDNFSGAQIEVQVYTPDRATLSGESVRATVGDGVEFGELPSSDISSTNVVDTNIDFSATSIEFVIGSSSVAGSFGDTDFNGYVFRDISGAIRPITNVTIDASGTTLAIEDDDIDFTSNSIDVNVAGLSYAPGDTIKLDVEFDV